MALTRAQAETVLINRCGLLMTEASLDGTTKDGTNSDINDALADSLLKMGETPSSIAAIADADLSGLSGTDITELLDRAELRLLETVSGNLVYVNIQIGPRREELAALAEQVEKRVQRLLSKVQREYGIGMGTISAGVIGLDFQTKTDDGPVDDD
jgi:hypothetical protein